jgi:hypothetical protein
MTDVEEGTPDAAPETPQDPWATYLAAAQRLDVLRRSAAAAQAEHTQAVQAAWDELVAVRSRLSVQRSALPSRGVPENSLTPGPEELATAANAVAGGPAEVLSALRGARANADLADAATVSMRPVGMPATGWSPWLRNLLVYGPFAVVVLLVQIALYLTADTDSLPAYALLCGFTMPLAAFGLGWITVGLVFGGGGQRVDRTPLIGALVCFSPILVTCMGVGVLTLAR